MKIIKNVSFKKNCIYSIELSVFEKCIEYRYKYIKTDVKSPYNKKNTYLKNRVDFYVN